MILVFGYSTSNILAKRIILPKHANRQQFHAGVIPIKLLSFAKAGTARGDDPDSLSSGKLGHPRHHDDGTNFSKTSRSI
jgi:hypothetical protein